MWQRASRSVVARAVAAVGAAGFVSSQTSLAEPEATSWGGGQLGQLGHPGEADRPLPTVIKQLKGVPVTQLVSGSSAKSSAAVSATGAVYTFGCGRDLRLGHGSSTGNQDVPKAVAGIDGKVVAAACGEAHTVVVTDSNEVWTFGKPRQGRLGRSCGARDGGIPGKADGFGASTPRIVGVSAGRAHSAAWDANGDVWTWGEGRDGATGSGAKTDVLKPHKVQGGAMAEAKASGLRVIGAVCGRDHTLVLLDNGAVLAMGADDVGQCGTGHAALRHLEPVWVRGLAGASDQPKAVAVLAGEQHSVALTSDGVAMAWGGNNAGQLMTGDRSDVGLPRTIDMAVFGGKRVIDGAAGGSHTLLRAEDGRVFACGRGRNGQLGRGTELESIAAFRVLPVEVVALGAMDGKVVKTLAAGSDHSLALMDDRT